MNFNIKLRYILILCISIQFCTASIKVRAADNTLKFNNITIEDGLSQSNVECIFQDSRGYIWIGTGDGLNRYNGYDFKVYRYEENISNSIAGSSIRDITEDCEGNIWVGTTSGLSKINVSTNEIKNYINSNICDILVNKKGSILVATLDGLNIYDKESDSFKKIFDKDSNILSGQIIYSLCEDELGNYWIATNKGLDKINYEKDEIKEFKFTEENLNYIKDNFIYKVISDGKGNIWIANFNSGLNKININTNEVTTYNHKENDENSLPGNYVKSVLVDSSGQIWVGTNKGLAKYLQDEEKFITYKSKAYDNESLVNNNISYLMEDKSGLIWVGTARGVSIVNSHSNILHYKNNPLNINSLSDNMIKGIYEDTEGFVWIATDQHGLNILDRNNEKFYKISKGKDIYSLNSNRINNIIGIGDEIWIGTDAGVNMINKKTKIVKKYTKEEGLSSNLIQCMFIDSKGEVWIGSNEGINILNRETGEIKDINYIFEVNNITNLLISNIYEDRDGVYWVGGQVDNGLIRLDMNSKTIKNYKQEGDNEKSLSFNSINDIKEDSKGNLWIATPYGLNKFDKSKESFTRYTKKEGMANNHIYSILIDEQDNPWVSTNNGISKLNIKNNLFKNYNVTDGLQSNEFNKSSSFKNSKGDMFFGGINGLNIFNPESLTKVQYLPKVVFDEFDVKGKKYANIDGLRFKSNENLISIKFFVPDYKENEKAQYYCKLDGVDDNWYEVEGNSVNYANLRPGKYTFRVKARNFNGTMSEESIVNFTVEPPFFLSKEALVIYILAGLIVLYNNRRKMKKLDAMVAEKTKELSEEMNTNEKLLNKIIELERRKNTHFINLSHELRTPLNVINSTEQLIYELNKSNLGIGKDKLNYYIKIMKKNTDRLLALINNLIDVSKIQYGNYPLNFKEVDIVYLVEETALSLKDYVQGKGIELIIDPQVEELVIECDSHEIERCIVNLISNAAKFTPIGGNIEVGIMDLGPEVMINVKDTGIGIDPKDHELIFDRFNQVVDPNSEVRRGSGLGLTLVKQIVELHNGEIYVESSLGNGSNFIIILPIKQPKENN
ncbi:ligand-binding sensor domain-containing protein [Clostridium tarantellae]|uniref:histidine kinase n=1 Tax=Clostridium tarantellae TaxID=39493 RepID=A0A6I1MI99_9CLOT|nr:sensor histidine kinase [Clostridium tarantellae]MPQ42433.1 histidine kinase [Clostridium tarantellae]